MYELFSAFFPILTSFSLKPLTRNHSYIMVYYVFLIRVCDDHSATWHFHSKDILTYILKFFFIEYSLKFWQASVMAFNPSGRKDDISLKLKAR